MGTRVRGALRLGLMLLLLGPFPLPPVRAPSESKCWDGGAVHGGGAQSSLGASCLGFPLRVL